MWRSRKPRGSKELKAKEMATLVEASQISESEIRRMHADFLDHVPSGRLNKKTFMEYFQKLHPPQQSDMSFDQLFEMVDANNDGIVDFNELLVVIVLLSRVNNLESRLSFAFDMWDDSGDGYIDKSELADVIKAIYDYASVTDRKGDRSPAKRASEIINKLDVNHDKKLSKEEFIKGCQDDPVIGSLLAPHA